MNKQNKMYVFIGIICCCIIAVTGFLAGYGFWLWYETHQIVWRDGLHIQPIICLLDH